MEPPVKEGDIITERCYSIGKKGDGIFKYERFIVIVPNTRVDHEYKIKITRVNEKVAFGEVEQ